MSASTTPIPELLRPYGPRVPFSRLVEEMNRLYHACEAKEYDKRRPEIFEQLPGIWAEMLARASPELSSDPWRVLDFGCGTGFEAEQLVRNLGQGQLAGLTCYDPSDEMLERCRAKLLPLFPDAVFVTDPDSIPRPEQGYNVLATNSVLHHLPDPLARLRELSSLLSEDAVWLAGHEPSRRYYLNSECVDLLRRYQRRHRWAKYFSPTKYVHHLLRLLGVRARPEVSAAREAFRKGLFEKEPPARLIGLLVDCHVVYSAQAAEEGRGFDYEDIKRALRSQWELLWARSYAFMGWFPEYDLPRRWRKACRELSARFPRDGANFCSLWKRGRATTSSSRPGAAECEQP